MSTESNASNASNASTPSTPNVTNDIEQFVHELDQAIAKQKSFKKENKAVFDENRMHTKTVNALKQKLLESMALEGISTVKVGSMEIEIKKDTRVKHNMELLENMLEEDGKFQEYISQVQEDSDKVIARTGKRRRT